MSHHFVRSARASLIFRCGNGVGVSMWRAFIDMAARKRTVDAVSTTNGISAGEVISWLLARHVDGWMGKGEGCKAREL